MNTGEVRFGTGAKEGQTHWKQTLFMLREAETVQKGKPAYSALYYAKGSALTVNMLRLIGTVVKGSFKCSKNPENSRELVVEMTWTLSFNQIESELRAQVWKVR